MAPAKGGTVGQVLDWPHDDSERRVLAASFAAWFERVADKIEKSEYIVTKRGLVPARFSDKAEVTAHKAALKTRKPRQAPP
jgi:hypothetical protein